MAVQEYWLHELKWFHSIQETFFQHFFPRKYTNQIHLNKNLYTCMIFSEKQMKTTYK